jgi:hypothetical protein
MNIFRRMEHLLSLSRHGCRSLSGLGYRDPMIKYQVVFWPAFHRGCCIRVEDHGTFGQVSIHAGRKRAIPDTSLEHEKSGIWIEKVNIPLSEYPNFINAMNSISPHLLRDWAPSGLDGIDVFAECRKSDNKVHTFHAWSPHENDSPLHYAFVKLIYDLAFENLKEEISLSVLEGIYGYFSFGLPVRKVGENPKHIRIYSNISFFDAAISAYLNEIPSDVPLIIEITEHRAIAPVQDPILKALNMRSGKTAWLSTIQPNEDLRRLEIDPRCIFSTKDEAIAFLNEE